MRRTPATLPLPLGRPASTSTARTPAKRPALRVAGLFAGIGGVELGLGRAGHQTELICEIDPGARAVLRARLPGVRLHDDVLTLKKLPANVDMLTGGFPCQDLSQAGKTVGIEGTRSGLVGEVFRLIESRRVPWVMLENVPFMLQLARGKAMDVLAAAFEKLGYRWSYRVVNSMAFGVPQRRLRVIFLASLDHDPREVLFGDDAGEPETPDAPLRRLACGFYWTEGIRGLGWAVDAVPTLKGGSTIGIPSSPGIVMPSGDVVTPDIRDAERMQGFHADWTTPSREVAREGHRWKLVGNAVTVDVFGWLGRRLREPTAFDPSAAVWPLRHSSPWPRAAWNVGDGRFGIELSTFPVNVPRLPLDEWLEYETAPLSLRATSGFLSRTAVSSLNFPDGFLDILRAHQRRMTRYPMTRKPSRGLEVREAAHAPLVMAKGGLVVDRETSLRLGRIRQAGTAPELAVRLALSAFGVRYRVQNRDLPGSPDLANRSRRFAIFVHGCFWHRHRGCRRTTTPKRNRAFWEQKFAANVARDARVRAQLRDRGFVVLTIWECDAEDEERLARRLKALTIPSDRPKG